MSDLLFPSFVGLTWPVQKRPVTSTIVQTTASGSELRASAWSSPLLEWGLAFDTLRTKLLLNDLAAPYAEYEELADFYNAHGGRRESFLFNDLYDNTAVASVFGEGDGVRTVFTLGRTLAGLGAIQIGKAVTITAVYIDGVATGAYSSSGNQITFSAAPAACAELSWSGTFYWRVRFRDDAADFANFVDQIWENRALWLRQVKGAFA